METGHKKNDNLAYKAKGIAKVKLVELMEMLAVMKKLKEKSKLWNAIETKSFQGHRIFVWFCYITSSFPNMFSFLKICDSFQCLVQFVIFDLIMV